MIKTFNLYVDWVATHLLHVSEPFKEAVGNSLGTDDLGPHLKVLVLGVYVYAGSLALLAIPGWFIYRTVNYQLTRDKCLEFVRMDGVDRNRQEKLIKELTGDTSGQVTVEVCSYFK